MEGNTDVIPHNVQFFNPKVLASDQQDEPILVDEIPVQDWTFSEGVHLLNWYENSLLRFGVMEYPGLYSSRQHFFIDKIVLAPNPTQ